MFVDKVRVQVQAGDGGNGYVSFRHEKFIDKGGPDGGDGGNGGNIVLRASRNQNTLASFRFQKLLKAESGEAGFKQRKHGKNGKDLIVDVPVGTILIDDNGAILADLLEDGQQAIVAKGGKGGFGNAHFTSSTRQAPRVAEKGEAGTQFDAVMELKMIADVGLVGLPNAGKSTFLATTSNARPEIANYPFTTIRPNLGMVQVDKAITLLIADIPGLIEGASEGKGLGDDFLRHVERTLVLVHLIDAYNDDVADAFKIIQKELKSYSIDLTSKPQVVALNKIDGLDDEIVDYKLKELKKVVPKGTMLLAISAQSGQNVKELLYKTAELVAGERAKLEAVEEALPVLRIDEADESWRIEKTDNGFIVRGRKIEKFAARTDFDNSHGVQRLRDIMKKMGILRKLVHMGIEAGDKITIHGYGSIEY